MFVRYPLAWLVVMSMFCNFPRLFLPGIHITEAEERHQGRQKEPCWQHAPESHLSIPPFATLGAGSGRRSGFESPATKILPWKSRQINRSEAIQRSGASGRCMLRRDSRLIGSFRNGCPVATDEAMERLSQAQCRSC